jgi:hypothetical protein
VLAFFRIVCVDPLRLGGLRGNKSTPSVGWEVPVRSHRLESGRWMEHAWDDDFKDFTFGYSTHVYIFIDW